MLLTFVKVSMRTAMLIAAVVLLNSNTRSQMKNTTKEATAANQPIWVLELRNYVTRPGQREKFISYFETNFIDSQNAIGGYILGQFRVKDADDNFFWIRGFNDMSSRSRYLPEFYRGSFWKEHRSYANDMLLNNDNVYLLKPLSLSEDLPGAAVNSNEFGKKKGLLVIDYYVANTRLKELIEFFKSKYLPLLKSNDVSTTSWVSELTENDFPGLPVFQDKNLLVTITPFKDEAEYQLKLKQINADPNQKVMTELMEIVTTKTTVVLHPTKNSFSR
ncbi:MAG TPA: NIPSNAP family protein [Pyrinomonadaceae bacterium]|nr:NIPSNAP family protein [Pyrinomonadaceae bacterium]